MKRSHKIFGMGWIIAAAVLLSFTVGAASKADYDKAVAEAKASLKKAASVRGEWRDSGDMLKKADEAAGKGDLDKAIKLANMAKQQGELGYAQAIAEKSAPPLSIISGMAPKPRKNVASASQFTSKSGPNTVKEGKELAMDRKKGNCVSCHAMDDGVSPGNMGPPLIAMKARFKTKGELRAQIWDATARNPETLMPPFGRHHVLKDEEIDKIAEYVWSL